MKMLVPFILVLPLVLGGCTLFHENDKNVGFAVSGDTAHLVPDTVENLGSGFTLEQSDEKTEIIYNERTVREWSHTPPEQIPFVWDESCELLWKRFDATPQKERELPSWKQDIWEGLTENEKKDCMKSHYSHIHTEAFDKRFYKIYRPSYENFEIWLYDTVSGNAHEFGTGGLGDDIKEIYPSKDTIKVSVGTRWGYEADTVVIFDTDFREIQSRQSLQTE